MVCDTNRGVRLRSYDPVMPPESNPFKVVSPFQPMGDQPAAIDALSGSIDEGKRNLCLLSATGTGKTFTMANVI